MRARALADRGRTRGRGICEQLTPGGCAQHGEVMGEMYLAMVENSAAQLVTALNIIAYSLRPLLSTARQDATGPEC